MLGKNRLRLWYGLGVTCAALAGITCTDLTTGPRSRGAMAQIGFQPVFTQAAIQAFQSLDEFGFGVNNVRVQLFHADGTLAKDTTVTVAAGQDSVVIEILVDLHSPQETFRAELELRDGTTVLFSGTQTIEATRGGATTPPPITVEYSGPGATATSLTLAPNDVALFAGDSVTFSPTAKDANGQDVPNIVLAWSVKDATRGTVTTGGKFTAASGRGSTYVIARLLTGLADSAKVGVVPRATKAVLISGGGQTATVGTALPQAIVVEAQAGDDLPVPGAALTVQVTGGGGSVGAASVVADANGRASIALTLGGAAGANSIQVGGTGLTPLSVSATGAPGQAKKLALAQQPSATASSGTALATQPKVQLQDALGNAVSAANVAITASLSPASSQTLGGPLTVNTDASGVATFAGLTISGPPATATITFKQDTLTSAVSGNIVVSTGAAAVMTLEGDAALSVVAGSALASPPSVLVTDAGGNAIAGADLRFVITSGVNTVRDVTIATGGDGRVSFANVPLTTAAGTYDIAVTIAGVTGTPVALTLSVTPGSAASIVADATNTLSDTVRANVVPTLLPAALVSDASGNPKAGIAVKIFGRGKPGAQLTGPSGPADTIQLTTNAQGKVNLAGRRLPQVAGLDTVFIVAAGIADTVRFVATVNAGNAHHMVYAAQPPAQVVSVTNFTVVVGFKDQFDNPLLSSSKTISLQLKPAAGNPSGTLSSPVTLSKVAAGGFADFSARVDLAGTGYVIQAVSTGLPNVDTTPFEIQVGPMAQLLVHGGTEGQGALKGGEVVIKARAMDAGGNDVNNVALIFAVQSGGGNVHGQAADTIATASTGQAIAQADWHVGTSGPQVTRVSANGITLDFHAFLAETLHVVQQPPTSTPSGAVLAQQPIVQLRDFLGNQAKVSGVLLYSQFAGDLGGYVTSQSATTDANGNASWSNMTLNGHIQTGQLYFSLPGCDCVEPPSIQPTKSANISLLAGSAIDIESADDTTAHYLNAAGTVTIHIKATDGFNGIPNTGVRFSRTAGGEYCTLTAADSVVMTDGTGVATMAVQVAGGYASCVVHATMTNPPTPPPCEGECFVPAPPSVTNRFFDAPVGTYIWHAEGYPTFSSPYWADWYNWSTGIVPTATSTVYIPVAAYHAPIVTGATPAAKHIYADNGAKIDTYDSDVVLSVHGDFVVDTVTNAGRIWLSPNGSTTGVLKAKRIEGNLLLGTDGTCTASATTLTSNVYIGTPGGTTDVDLRCKLDVSSFTLTTANDFVVSTPGELIQTLAASQVLIGGSASFNGTASQTAPTAGLIEIKKNFSTSGSCFNANGTHVTRMTSAASDTVNMDAFTCQAAFATLELAGSAPVKVNSSYQPKAKNVRVKTGAKWIIPSGTSFTILFGGSFDVESGALFRRLGSFFVGSCGTYSLDSGPDFPGPFSCAGYNPS